MGPFLDTQGHCTDKSRDTVNKKIQRDTKKDNRIQ